MGSEPGLSPKRSLFKLLGDVPGLIVDLFRQEIENLKQELVDKVKHAGVGVGLLAGAGVVAQPPTKVLTTIRHPTISAVTQRSRTILSLLPVITRYYYSCIESRCSFVSPSREAWSDF